LSSARLKKLAIFIPLGQRLPWGLLAVYSIILSAFEVAATMAVFRLIQLVTDPSAATAWLSETKLRGLLRLTSFDEPILALSAGVALLYIVKNLFTAYVQYRQAATPLTSANGFAGRLFSSYLGAPYIQHLYKNSAEIQRNLNASVDAVYRNVLYSCVTLISEALMSVSIICVVLITNPVMTIYAMSILGALVFVVYRIFQKKTRQCGIATQAMSAYLLQTVNQALGCLKEIKILGCEGYFIGEFQRRRKILSDVLTTYTTVQQYPRLVLETIFVCVMSFILFVGKRNSADFGSLAPLIGLYAYTGFRVIPSLNRILVALQTVRFGSAAIDDVLSDLDKFQGQRLQTKTTSISFDRELVLHDISFSYPGTEEPALVDVNLTIKPGEAIGFVGTTGAGKTTLADIILGLLTPSRGEMLVDGNSILEGGLEAWRRHLGYVPQAVFLLDDTLRRNIALGVSDAEIDDARIRSAIATAQMEDVVAGLPGGLDSMVGERGVRLSGGQRQRLAIARALYHEPDVLVLDEATAALDNRTEQHLSQAIERMAGTRTLLIVAHRLNTIRNCDRIVVMNRGRVVGVGTYDALLSNCETFRELALQEAKAAPV